MNRIQKWGLNYLDYDRCETALCFRKNTTLISMLINQIADIDYYHLGSGSNHKKIKNCEKCDWLYVRWKLMMMNVHLLSVLFELFSHAHVLHSINSNIYSKFIPRQSTAHNWKKGHTHTHTHAVHTYTHISYNSENAKYKRCNYIGFNSRTKICFQICIFANTQSSLTPVTN